MAWAEKRGRRYRGVYRDPGGKAHTAGWHASKREAKKLAEAEEQKIRRGEWHDPRTLRLAFLRVGVVELSPRSIALGSVCDADPIGKSERSRVPDG